MQSTRPHTRREWLRRIPVPDLGARNGMLEVVGYKIPPEVRSTTLILRCDCGQQLDNSVNDFLRPRVGCKSCALRLKPKFRADREAMPDNVARDYWNGRYNAMVDRCTKPAHPGYPDYGGRGIGVFALWLENKSEFLRHITTLPGWQTAQKNGLHMDRIKNDVGYQPGNLRLITKAANNKNKRRFKARDTEQLKRDVSAAVALLLQNGIEITRELQVYARK